MRRIIAVILALGALMALPAPFTSSALADGDPASDVLAFKPVFDPFDAGLSAEQGAQLSDLVQTVTREGYKIRVALIASSGDLGTVTELWQNPGAYCRYLGKELSLVWGGAVLVVMPQGYGLYVPDAHPPAADVRVMDAVVAPGSQLAQGAFATVAKLAQANGVRVNVGHVDIAAAGSRGSSVAPWIVFLLGLLCVGGAWGASVRLRPLARRVAA